MKQDNTPSQNTYQVASLYHGQRIDRVIQSMTAMSRKKVKALLDHGQVWVNQKKIVIASWEAKKGDKIEIRTKEELSENPISADEYFLKVVHHDKDILVVERDAGVPCETSLISTRPTLVAIINAYLKRRYKHLPHHYVGLVHRLDQDTSGLMVYSLSKDANKIISQFKKHTIQRKYLAIVQGSLKKSEGTIKSYLKKSELLKGGKKVTESTEESGQLAVTQYRLIECYPRASLVELTLNTGRTHQIRVHMASLGHPVIGDKVYGAKPKGDERLISFPRQALHASYLAFYHPITSEPMEFKSELPKDLKKLLIKLRKSV
ncbi:MAG: RluA family pseudouridine synthase [Deltaproteobacteria bacterium]|nr:MAG: RluA family pseudouridine synthase [Deltaproteobacteria bacterium]